MKKFTMFILATTVAASISSTALAAEIPRESAPANATEESIVITENLIGGILDEVQNGLGYQPAWCEANNAIFNAVLAKQTNGYEYADLAAILCTFGLSIMMFTQARKLLQATSNK